MSNNNNPKKRSNSFHSNHYNNSNIREFDNNKLNKSINVTKKEMIKFKKIQNIDLTTYNYIFLGRLLSNRTLQDFESYIKLLKDIKNKYNSKMLINNNNIEIIKKEGKFPLNNYNLTELVPFIKNNKTKFETSINTRYIKTFDCKKNYINFYGSKCFFKGKHCFEIQILNVLEPKILFGLINIIDIEFLKNYIKKKNKIISLMNNITNDNKNDFNIFAINEPLLIQKKNNIYNHYISYGDILGICYDLDQKVLLLFLNGEIVNTYDLSVITQPNDSFSPIISLGDYTEILFNPGENLKYEKEYKKYGFIPLDEKGKNNYEISKLREVTEEYNDILFNKSKSIINNKNITYSDINQIYHIIFDFLGNVSFHHSYIIQKCFIDPFLQLFFSKKEYNINDELEIYYICLKYILNSAKDKKTIIKNFFFNLAETIHIYLRNGEIKYIVNVQNLIKLFTFLFRKKKNLDILIKMPKILKQLFTSIFISFHIHDNELLHNNDLDFVINSNSNNVIINNSCNNKNIDSNSNNNKKNNHKFFPNLIISKKSLKQAINLMQIKLNDYSNIILNFYKELIILFFENGEDTQNKRVFKIFKKFLENEISKLIKPAFYIGKYKFIDLSKTIFIPAMDAFNQEYKKTDKIISIKKYLSKLEVDGEKLGGTIKHIYEEIEKDIPNFEKLQKYSINDYNNVFFIEFLYFFFIKKNSNEIWEIIIKIIDLYNKCINFDFLRIIKNESFKVIHNELSECINYKLYQFDLNDLYIFLQFLYNVYDIIQNKLYLKKLIYFLPEIIISRIKYPISILHNISILITLLINTYNSKKNKNNNVLQQNYMKEKYKLMPTLIELTEKCLIGYLSILVNIIKDQNIKKLALKCESIDCLKNYIYYNNYFTDQDIYSIFNFIYIIHNNSEYKKNTFNFMKIFEKDMSSEKSKYYKFGERLINAVKNNKMFLRILIILLYNNMNDSLSKLEERFCEYKYNPESNHNDNNIQNNQIILINNNNEQINIINDNNNQNGDNGQITDLFDNLRINLINLLFRIDNRAINDEERLILLEESFKGANQQFIKLINFYKISSDISELYDINSLENKYLNNLLLSLYNIIFSPNNISKVYHNNKINNSYKILLTNIYIFYSIIINNILKQNNAKLLEELAKQRNLFHFKEIFEIFEKVNPQGMDNNNNNTLKNFIEKLQDIIPEEKTIKLININIIKGSETKIEKNICLICADSVIDTHILPCEHAICRNCLFQNLSESKLCPFCRKEIKGIKEDPNFKV